jgi:DGQHR domain-containing protein
MAKKSKSLMRRRALRIEQDPDHPLFLFSLTGEELLQIADISRISRDDAGKLLGYQRAEVKRHIQDIVDYLNSEKILFPNAIILALSSNVKFTSSRGPDVNDGCATAGSLEIPLSPGAQHKPAWIVDGQQRALALSKCDNKTIPIPISAFIADEVDLQRDQFLRVNSTRPLSRGLITELLPEVSTVLPTRMAARRIPSAVCDWLNQSAESPFQGLIKRVSTPAAERHKAVIADNSIVNMIEESLSSPSGCLFPYRNMASGETDFEGICKVLVTFWAAVRDVFPDAWGKSPAKSRLMGGVGIRAVGRLMDRIMPGIKLQKKNAANQTKKEIQRITNVCRWTSGRWEELDGLKWNELQNVPRHVNILSNYLIRTYTQAWGRE